MWVAWRMHRRALVVSLSFIAVLVVTTLTATVFLERNDSTWRFGSFCSRWNDVGPCRPETALTFSTLFALLLPLLLGMFVGVPVFSRELEQRTHVLGLTQSISRVKWYFTKVTVVFLPIATAMVGLGLCLRLASTAGGNAREPAMDNVFGSIEFSLFDFPHFETTGIALGGYTLVSLLLGSTAAILFRSTVGAMSTTIVAFLIVPVAFTLVVRDDYGTPGTEAEPIRGLYRASEYTNPYRTLDSTWVVGAGYVDAEGARVYPDESLCAPDYDTVDRAQRDDETNEEFYARRQAQQDLDAEAFDVCLREQGVDRFEVEYYTEDQYWRFQTIETALMLLAAGATSVVGLWGIRRLRP